jgi:hypothetical protein
MPIETTVFPDPISPEPPSSTRHCGLRLAFALVLTLTVTTPAYALPTPDLMASLVNVLPLVAGAAASGGAGLMLLSRRLFGRR